MEGSAVWRVLLCCVSELAKQGQDGTGHGMAWHGITSCRYFFFQERSRKSKIPMDEIVFGAD